MIAITGPRRITPVVPLQEHAQVNALDELVHQRREARKLKDVLCDSARALIAYAVSPSLPPLPGRVLPPWQFLQINGSKPTDLCRPPATNAASALQERIAAMDRRLPPGSTIIHTDFSIRGTAIATAIHSTSHTGLNKTSRFKVRKPPSSLCAELVAIREALFAVTEIALQLGARIVISTDALQAIRILRLITGSTTLDQSIRHLAGRIDHEVQVAKQTSQPG